MSGIAINWTGDLLNDCELRVGEWSARCVHAGNFMAQMDSEAHPHHDRCAPLSAMEYWFCWVHRWDECIYHSDLGGNLICGGDQCRAICEAIIRAAHGLGAGGMQWED